MIATIVNEVPIWHLRKHKVYGLSLGIRRYVVHALPNANVNCTRAKTEFDKKSCMHSKLEKSSLALQRPNRNGNMKTKMHDRQ